MVPAFQRGDPLRLVEVNVMDRVLQWGFRLSAGNGSGRGNRGCALAVFDAPPPCGWRSAVQGCCRISIISDAGGQSTARRITRWPWGGTPRPFGS